MVLQSLGLKLAKKILDIRPECSQTFFLVVLDVPTLVLVPQQTR